MASCPQPPCSPCNCAAPPPPPVSPPRLPMPLEATAEAPADLTALNETPRPFATVQQRAPQRVHRRSPSKTPTKAHLDTAYLDTVPLDAPPRLQATPRETRRRGDGPLSASVSSRTTSSRQKRPLSNRSNLRPSEPATPKAPATLKAPVPTTPKIKGHACCGIICAVCHSPLDASKARLHQLGCSHVYHRECLESCRAANCKACPLCRAPLPPGLTPLRARATFALPTTPSRSLAIVGAARRARQAVRARLLESAAAAQAAR
mmetsp:Transcript_20955/g.72156  ORF Transcript_20955/g.72156 Transcript_20955/m.72156 type:complete len:262 (-) Transcript_20955:443-1228(-)